jgi:8-oxo-dGTP pyrophosphatase MutT (NUDIX family)
MFDVQKVCLVILRSSNLRVELLAFQHPVAGKQLIKGSVKPNEDLATAAARELREESGIKAAPTQYLGNAVVGAQNTTWHFFLFEVEGLPDQWEYVTEDDHGHVFKFFWHPIYERPDEEWDQIFLSAYRELLKFLDIRQRALWH